MSPSLPTLAAQDWLMPLGGATPAFLVSLAPLFALLAWAAWIDWHTRRIPNWLTFSLLGGGLLRSLLGPVLMLGDFGVLDALLGCAAGFVLSVPLFAIGARGAGDAKLYIACGAWLGWMGVLAIFAIEAVVGLVMVLVQCAVRNRLGELFRNTGVLVMSVLYVRRIGVEQAQANARQFTSIDQRLPHAVPFFAAAVISLLAAIV
jgi:prepilin peptidase CpaA